MKKKVKNVRLRYGGAGNLMKKMKLLVAFFFAGLLVVSASSYSQQTKLSLKLDEVTSFKIQKALRLNHENLSD